MPLARIHLTAEGHVFSLKGKVAVVTGGAGAMGKGVAQALASAGAKVFLTDLKDRFGPAAAALSSLGLKVTGLEADAMQPDSLKACRQRILSEHESIDILVNLAGGNQRLVTTGEDLRFFDIKLEDMQSATALNLFAGAFLPCQAFGESMAKNVLGGSIINMASVAALRPLARVPGYAAAKAAVLNFTQWLAVHLAQGYNPRIRVNALAPGFIHGAQNRMFLMDNQGRLTDRGRHITSQIPMGRFGEPDDLAGPVVFLASDAARYVTGTLLLVDGGFCASTGT